MNKKDIYIVISKDQYIRIVTCDDVNDLYLETLNDKKSLQYMGNARNNPFNQGDLCKYIDAQYHGAENYLFGLFENNQLIATSRIHDIANQQAWQGVLVFISARNKKKGQLIIKNVSEFSLINLNILKLNAGILKENATSQRVFNQSGFIHEKNDGDRQIWTKIYV